jgi:hypothetical protein
LLQAKNKTNLLWAEQAVTGVGEVMPFRSKPVPALQSLVPTSSGKAHAHMHVRR